MKLLALLFALVACSSAPAAAQATVWHLDNLSRIGGNSVTVVGSPQIVDTELGRATRFNGHDDMGDALFVDALPLTGTLPYTIEVIFRPASGGAEAQRFFHMQQAGSDARRMFELRIVRNRWCLDTVAFSIRPGEPARSGILLNCDDAHVFPLDRWYAIAAVYDGKVLRAYVNGALQGEIAAQLDPLQAPGGVSIGTRFNRKFFFKGDILEARFSRTALTPSGFLSVPMRVDTK